MEWTPDIWVRAFLPCELEISILPQEPWPMNVLGMRVGVGYSVENRSPENENILPLGPLISMHTYNDN